MKPDTYFDPATMTFSVEVTDDKGNEAIETCRAVYDVCPRCQGHGKHDHPAFSNGFTSEEMDADPDFRDEYLSGRYDVTCSMCDGKNVVPVIAEGEEHTPAAKWLRKREEDDAMWEAERRMEARMLGEW